MRFLLKEEWVKNFATRDRIPQSKLNEFVEDIYNQIGKLSCNFSHEISGIALTLFHYYTYFKSFREIDRLELSVACVYLACKIQFRQISTNIVLEWYNKAKAERKDITNNIKPDFIKYEIEIYSFLGYDLDIETPYCWFYKFRATSKGKDLDDKIKNFVFNIINDTYRKSLCLYYHPKIIMLSALCFTIKFLDIKIQIEDLLKGEEIDLISQCMENIYEIFEEKSNNSNNIHV